MTMTELLDHALALVSLVLLIAAAVFLGIQMKSDGRGKRRRGRR